MVLPWTVASTPESVGVSEPMAQPGLRCYSRAEGGRHVNDAAHTLKTSFAPGPGWLAGLSLALLLAWGYGGVLHAPLVLDDPLILASQEGMGMADLLFSEGQQRPLTSLTLLLDRFLFPGAGPWRHRLPNVLLHGLAAWFLFDLARRLLARHLPQGPGSWLALAVAGAWALHPLQTETVVSVVQRAEVLVGLFAFLSLWCLWRSDAAANRGESLAWQAGMLAALAAGFASKEAMVSVPPLLVLFDRAFLADSWRDLWRRRRGLYVVLGGLALAGTAVLTFRARLLEDFSGSYPYAVTQAEVICGYLGLALWPDPASLCFDYAWPIRGGAGDVLGSLLFIGLLLAATGWALWRHPHWGFLGAWFLICLAPRSSFLPRPDAAVEHRMYLPLAAVVALVIVGGWVLLDRLAATIEAWTTPHRRRARNLAGMVLGGLLMVVLATGTRARNQLYRDPLALWADTVRKVPENPRALNYLGIEHAGRGHLAEAEDCFRRSLDIDTKNPLALNNLGAVVKDQGRLEEALAIFRELAVSIKPDKNPFRRNARALVACHLGDILSRLGHEAESEVQLQHALELAPEAEDVKIMIEQVRRSPAK
jgi:cytochrome c-type biogenesis protein CcmH/NrfG